MVKKQLKDLLRRHRDFKTLLLASNIDEVNIGNLSFASVSVPLDAASFHFSDAVSICYLLASLVVFHVALCLKQNTNVCVYFVYPNVIRMLEGDWGSTVFIWG